MADMPWESLVSEAGAAFNPVDPGVYKVRIKDAEAKTSKTGGNPMIAATLEVVEGPHAGKQATSPWKHHMVKMASTAGMFLGNMKALGIAPETLIKANPTMEQLAKAIVGKVAVAEIEVNQKQKQNDGSDILQVKGTLRAPEGGAVAVTSFPQVSNAESLGYGPQSGAVATTTDPGF